MIGPSAKTMGTPHWCFSPVERRAWTTYAGWSIVFESKKETDAAS